MPFRWELKERLEERDQRRHGDNKEGYRETEYKGRILWGYSEVWRLMMAGKGLEDDDDTKNVPTMRVDGKARTGRPRNTWE